MSMRYIKLLLDFAAKTLYYIERYKVSFDKAFHYALNDMKNKLKGYSLRRFYNVAWSNAVNYYKLRFIERQIYRTTGGTKRLTRLWALYFGGEILNDIKNYSSFKRRIQRDLPKYVDLDNILASFDLTDEEKLSVELSYPLWFTKLLVELLGVKEARELLKHMNIEKYWLRVNTLKIDVDKAIKQLEKNNVVVEKDKDLWYMLKVIEYKKPLYELNLVKEGSIIIQDKGSALVVEALNPQPGDVIFDACAAPGIKTSLIMQLTENKCKIIAADISRDRIKSMLKLLRLYGVDLDRIDIIVLDSTKKVLRRNVHKALVDAPCSSSGTVSRDPAIKIHLNDVAWVKRFPQIQKRLLLSIAMQAEEIVYATCSLIPWEGEEVIESVLSQAHLHLTTPTIIGDRGYSRYQRICAKVKRLYPHKHDVEGFFIAKFVKK